MIVKPFKRMLVIVSLACLPVSASFAAGLEVGVGQKVSFTRSCNTGNFQGYVEGEYGNTAAGGKYVNLKRYKIVRINGQKGGNKANVDLTYEGQRSKKHKSILRSSDNLSQDSKWHALNSFKNTGIRTPTTFGVEFIFDKSGPDPKCSFEQSM